MMATQKQIHPLFMSKEDKRKLEAKHPSQDVVVESPTKAPPPAPTQAKPAKIIGKRPNERRKPRAAREGSGSNSDSKEKPQRKQKVEKEGESFRGRNDAVGAESRRKSRRSLPTPSYALPPLDLSDLAGGDANTGADMNESRRKRRKKSNSPASESQSAVEDSLMEDVAPVVAAAAPQETVIPPKETILKPPEPASAPQPTVPEKPKAVSDAARAPAETDHKKPVHPFFWGGKKAPSKAPKDLPSSGRSSRQASPEKTEAIAPQKVVEPKRKAAFTGFTITPSSRERKVFQDQLEVPWPTREQCHVRNLIRDYTPPARTAHKRLEASKRKERLVEVTKGEDVLAVLADRLRLDEIKHAVHQPSYAHDKFFSVSDNIEPPQRLLFTGEQLQEEVRRRLMCLVPPPGRGINRVRVERRTSVSSSDSTNSLVVVIPHSKPTDDIGGAHPAIKKLYLKLFDTKAPYDEGKCSSASWLQKYAPSSTKEVLQSKANLDILRDWLRRLRVDNVETAESSLAKAEKRKKDKQDGKMKAAKRKRVKRVPSDLDGFLADSDGTLDEITDPDETGSNCDFSFMTGPREKSKVAKFSPAKNVIVIAGPEGCGKTAAVHAVAKELGYSVFELNAGNRRSGKDILDQVGQMSKNHLVHQAKDNNSPFSFAKKDAKKEKKLDREKDNKATQQQQQSLILFEEVDLLFEEDKQFWPTITTLASESKRPIILTCNEKDLIPIQSLPIHATLEFAKPDPNIAVDYMLTMAALEGHLLERDVVQCLYKYTQADLRNSISQLQLWCQMGVGDRHSGISWLNIERLSMTRNTDRRVISKDTLRKGLGFYPETQKADRLPEEEVWKFAWDEYELDLGGEDVGMHRLQENWAQDFKTDPQHRLHGLQSFEMYAEALSAADVYSLDGMRGIDEPVLETLTPKATEKTIAEEIVGYTHLRPLQKTSPTTVLNTQFAISARYLARKTLQKETLDDIQHPSIMALPDISIDNMIYSITDTEYLRWPMTMYDPQKIRQALNPLLYHIAYTSTKSVLAAEFAPYIRGVVRFDDHFIRKQDELRKKGKRTSRRSTGTAVVSHRQARGARWWGGMGDIWSGILDTGSDDWSGLVVYPEQEKEAHEGHRGVVVDDDEMEGVESS